MNAEQTFLVRQRGIADRSYRVYELTWLWRSGAIAQDAHYQYAAGDWRLVADLVDQALRSHKKSPPSAAKAWSPAPWQQWILGAGAVSLVGAIAFPAFLRQYSDWKTEQDAVHAAATEQGRALQDRGFVASNLVTPGMTREDVRRIIGPGRSVRSTGDGRVERWIYRQQIIVFEDGKVVGTEDVR